jgi:hypothetical protein
MWRCGRGPQLVGKDGIEWDTGRRHVCPLSREGKLRALESYAGPKPESIGVKEEIEQRRRRKPLKRSGGKLAERIREVVTGGGG